MRLTELSHGGGCGCKMAPGVLQQILSKRLAGQVPPQLLVGIETSDDAAVWKLDETRAIVATTDFFMPIVDDPHDFGRIAGTNAISDVYAMGGTPLFALAIVGMPLDKLAPDVIARILEGGEAACAAAGIPVAGGHSIDATEPIYGLAVVGLVDPRRLKRNVGARPGDSLILGKGLGIGIMSAALKKGALDDATHAAMIRSTTKLNSAGARLAALDGVHALTDVTGFGLLGHLLEICRGSSVAATLLVRDVPVLHGVRELLARGFRTGASARNWSSMAEQVRRGSCSDEDVVLLTDPQTSGGLLVACAPEAEGEALAIMRADGLAETAVIGRFVEGAPGVDLR